MAYNRHGWGRPAEDEDVRDTLKAHRKRKKISTTTTHPHLARLMEIDGRMEALTRQRNLTGDDEREAHALIEEFDQLDKDGIREMVERGEVYIDRPVTANGDDWSEDVVLGHGGGDWAARSRVLARDDAMRMLDASVRDKSLPEYAADRVEKLVTDGPRHDQSLTSRWVQVTGNAAYRSAFSKKLAHGEEARDLWTPQEQAAWRDALALQTEMRAMTLTDNAGGYLVPFQIDPSIILTSAGSVDPMRRIARQVVAVGDVWHGVTSAGVTAEWLAEAAEAADASPSLGQPSVPLHKGSAFVPYSYEVGMDGTSFTQELSRLLVDAADQLQAAAFATGDGSGKPTGIVTALTGTASEVNAAADDTFASGDVFALQNALPPRFQPRAEWCANLSIINVMRQFETGNGALKFPELVSGQLLNRRINEMSNMDGAIGTSGAVSNFVLVYGDFNNYVIADGIGTTIELIPNLVGSNRRPTGQRGLFMWLRTGGDSVNDNAFRMLDVASAS